MAGSSVIEIDSQLEASLALQYINEEDAKELNAVIREEFKMLSKLIER